MNVTAGEPTWLSSHIRLYSKLAEAQVEIHLMLIAMLQDRIHRQFPCLNCISWKNRDVPIFEFKVHDGTATIPLAIESLEISDLHNSEASNELYRSFGVVLTPGDDCVQEVEGPPPSTPSLFSNEQLGTLLIWTKQLIDLIDEPVGNFDFRPTSGGNSVSNDVVSIAECMIEAAEVYAIELTYGTSDLSPTAGRIHASPA